MISILLCSRKKDNTNPHASLLYFLDSLKATASRVEVLIKFDEDDNISLHNIVPHLNNYNLNIRYFITPRQLGNDSFHTFFNELYLKTDPNSQLIFTATDDIRLIQRDWDCAFLNDFSQIPHQLAMYGHYCYHRQDVADAVNRAECFYAISRKLLQVIGSWGLVYAIDAWTTAVTTQLYRKYGINLWKSTGLPFCERVEQSWPNPDRLKSRARMIEEYKNPNLLLLVSNASDNIYNYLKVNNYV